MKRLIMTSLVFGIALMVYGSAPAQIQMTSGVFGSGAGGGSGADHIVRGTVGQVFTGVTVNTASLFHETGFWYQPDWFYTSVDDIADIPRIYHLDQNYPNPFNPITTIRFGIPETARVVMQLYDIKGRRVAILMDQDLDPGVYRLVYNAVEHPSGMYFYSIRAGTFSETRKLVLLK